MPEQYLKAEPTSDSPPYAQNPKDGIMRFTHRPSIRTRMFQWLTGKMVRVNKIKEHNCRKARQALETWANRQKLPPSVKTMSGTLDGFSYMWVIPPGCSEHKILYYLHGGGYSLCSANTHKRLIAALAGYAGMKALAINYRLAPEFRFPTAVTDAIKGYEFLLQSGFNAQHIVFAGDSAGGGLALSVLFSLKERKIPMPAAAVLISPWTDLTGSGQSLFANKKTDPLLTPEAVKLWGAIYAGPQVKHPLASPIYGDFSGLPPLCIQVSDSEILLDDALRAYQCARDAAVPCTLEIWHGLMHVWQIHTFLPEARKALQRLAAFIHSTLRLVMQQQTFA
ncbi:MAG: hydrolase [Chitinophagales bacterium]|nr:MAG: hydrolase [Chitinophagales bacterium]